MREIEINVPHFDDFYRCSSGSLILGSQFFVHLCGRGILDPRNIDRFLRVCPHLIVYSLHHCILACIPLHSHGHIRICGLNLCWTGQTNQQAMIKMKWTLRPMYWFLFSDFY